MVAPSATTASSTSTWPSRWSSAATARAPTRSSSSPCGYSACFASALGLVGRAAKVDVSDAAVTAEVGIGKQGEGFALKVTLRVELPDTVDAATGRKLVEQAHQVCPYSNATRNNIPVELVVE